MDFIYLILYIFLAVFYIYRFICYQLLYNGFTCSYMCRLNYSAIIRETSTVGTTITYAHIFTIL
jgi:hypothetical protein